MRTGGQNRTHLQLERAEKIDSFEMYLRSHGNLFVSNSYMILQFDYMACDGPDTGMIELSYPENGWKQAIVFSDTFGVYPQRFWICPSCGKRVRFLYFNGRGFKCRKCANLNYRTQQQYRDSIWYYDHGLKYAQEKLGFEKPEWLVPIDFPDIVPDKPKGMHKSTYERIIKKYQWYQAKYEEKFAEELAAVGKFHKSII